MQPYLQTTPFTCAASSLLTILHHFHPQIELNQENEFKIWRETVTLPTRGSSIFALANYAKKQGLNPRIVVESKKYGFPDYRFYRYTKDDIDLAAFSSFLHLKEAENNQIPIEEREIILEEIKKELNQKNILILRINAKPLRKEKRNTSNYIIVLGFNSGYYNIIDPKVGAVSIPEETMKEAFDTLETKKYRDHRMMVFEGKE